MIGFSAHPYHLVNSRAYLLNHENRTCVLHWAIYSIRYRSVHYSYFPQFMELHSPSISAWLNHCMALTYALQLKMNEYKIIYIQKL